MTTIEKTIHIPASRRLEFEIDLPANVPTGGEAKVFVVLPTVSPVPNTTNQDVLLSLAGKLAGSSLFARDAVELQREWRDEWD